MTKEEFITGMEKLVTNYGPRSFPPERIQLFYNYVAHANDYMWKRTVDKVLLTFPKTPSLSDITQVLDAVSKSCMNTAYRPEVEEILKPETPEMAKENKWFFANLKEFLAGRMPQNEWEAFKAHIEEKYPRAQKGISSAKG